MEKARMILTKRDCGNIALSIFAGFLLTNLFYRYINFSSKNPYIEILFLVYVVMSLWYNNRSLKKK